MNRRDSKPVEAEPHSPLIKLLAILYFMSASMLVQYMTKSIFTNYGFKFPLTVAMLQMAFICPVTYAIVRPPITFQLAKSLAPLALVNTFNVIFGLIGTGGLTVPMFIALRRFTLLFTILLERFYMGKSHDWPTLVSVGIMISGALVAAATDLSFNAYGYGAVLINDILTSLYLSMVKNIPASGSLTTTGMLFYNSALSLPLLMTAVVVMGEPMRMVSFPRLYDPKFHLALLVSSGLGLTINHSMFVCTRVNEPLMTSVAGNLKNAIMTVVGALAFPDFKFSPPNVAGLALSMAGAIWYAMRSALKASAKSFNGSSSSNLMQQLPSFGMGGMARFKSSRSGSFNDDELLLPKEGQNGAGVLGPARLAKVEAK